MTTRLRMRDRDTWRSMTRLFTELQIEIPVIKMMPLIDGIIDAFIEELISVPGSSLERRETAVELMVRAIELLRDNETISIQDLHLASGLPVDNKSDRFFVRRFAKETGVLQFQPGTPSRFVKRITNGNTDPGTAGPDRSSTS